MTSLCPLMYFVVLCTTMSAPRSRGVLEIGAGECVVDHEKDLTTLDSGDPSDIDDVHEGIRRTLDPDESGLVRMAA